jgi:hypothetical protein
MSCLTFFAVDDVPEEDESLPDDAVPEDADAPLPCGTVRPRLLSASTSASCMWPPRPCDLWTRPPPSSSPSESDGRETWPV